MTFQKQMSNYFLTSPGHSNLFPLKLSVMCLFCFHVQYGQVVLFVLLIHLFCWSLHETQMFSKIIVDACLDGTTDQLVVIKGSVCSMDPWLHASSDTSLTSRGANSKMLQSKSRLFVLSDSHYWMSPYLNYSIFFSMSWQDQCHLKILLQVLLVTK